MKINLKTLMGIGFLILFIMVLVLLFSWESHNLIFVLSSLFFLAYSLIILNIFQHNRHEEDPKAKSHPPVTVLIPAHNEAGTIAKTVKSVKELKYPKSVEVIVLDDGSTDSTYKLTKNIKGIKVVRFERNKGKAAVLNHGISIAKGDLVACIDADTFPKRDALMKMTGYFNDENVGAVTTLITVDKPRTFLQKLQELEYYVAFGFWHKSLSAIDSLYVTPGPMSVYRKDALKKIGGYDEKNLTEDLEIALNLKKHGYKIACCTSTKAVTTVPSSVREFIRQRLRWYRGAVYNFIFKHRDLMFSKKNKEFSYFIFPVISLAIFITAALAFGYIFLNFRGFIDFFYINTLKLYNGVFGLNIRLDPLLIPSYYLNIVILFLVWGYFLYTAVRLDKDRDIKSGKIHAFIYLMFYGLVVGLIYLISIFQEFLWIRKKW